MPKITGLSEQEMIALDQALNPVVHGWMEIFEKHATSKAETVAFRMAETGLNMSGHLPLDRKLGALVDGSNRLLPVLQKYLNDQTLAAAIPAELRTPQIADLCDKAGATPLAKLMRKSFNVAAAPVPVPAAAVAAAQPEPVKTVAAVPDPSATLIAGFERFRAANYKNGAGLMEKLVKEGAHPEIFVINCIDSRASADLVFNAPPGQQFTHAQMGAIVPPYDEDGVHELNASLHYAVDIRKVKHLIVMGHSDCAGCAVLADKTDDPYLAPWVSVAREAVDRADDIVDPANKAALHHETERQVLALSLRNLLQYPVIKKAVAEGRLTVHGWFFDMDHGGLLEYNPAKKEFRPLGAAASSGQPALQPRPS